MQAATCCKQQSTETKPVSQCLFAGMELNIVNIVNIVNMPVDVTHSADAGGVFLPVIE
jgi:hypothetical protein